MPEDSLFGLLSDLEDGVVHSSEIMVNFYHTTCCNTPDEGTVSINLFNFTMNRWEYQLSHEIKHFYINYMSKVFCC